MANFGAVSAGAATYLQAKACANNPDVGLTHVFDINHVQALKLRERLRKDGLNDLAARLVVCNTFDELISSGVDFISINVPPFAKDDVVRSVASAKIPLIVEKPLAPLLAAAENWMWSCQQQGVSFGCISQHRYEPDVIRAKEIVDNNYFGRLVAAKLDSVWTRDQAYFDCAEWRGTWHGEGGGVLMNHAWHGVDTLQYLIGDCNSLGATMRTVGHDIPVEDLVVAMGNFGNDASTSIFATTCGKGKDLETITLFFERGKIILANYDFAPGSGEYDHNGRHLVEHLLPSQQKGECNGALSHGGHDRQLALFGNSVKRGVILSPVEAYRTLETVMMMYCSFEEGGRLVSEVSCSYQPDPAEMLSRLRR